MSKPAASVCVKPAAESPPAAAPADVLLRTFNELRDELVSTLWFLLGNQEDARDAAQDAFLKCWRARAKVREVRDLRAWIFRVGLNAAKDLRRGAWHRRAKPLRGEDVMLAGHEAAPGQAAEDREMIERLRLAIQTLRPDEQEVFLLRQNGDLTYEQIAEMRHSPIGTVKTQMRSALQKLRQHLAPKQTPA